MPFLIGLKTYFDNGMRGYGEEDELELELAPGWNLIGIPFELDLGTTMALQDANTMGYDPATQTYITNLTEFLPGQGFWLFAPQRTSFHLQGYTDTTPERPALLPGWNLVSPLYYEKETLPSGRAMHWTPQGNRKYTETSKPPTLGTGYWLQVE